MNHDLTVTLHDRIVGHITKTGPQSAVMRYEPSHLEQYDPTPLSLAFPLDDSLRRDGTTKRADAPDRH